MKKLILLSSMIILALCIKAQSVAVNTDGNAAHGSSIFEAKSTTKGLLIPRMTSAQRSAIAAPALGLLVFDTDTKTIWAFNGIAWSNLTSAGGGSLTLPFSQSVNMATSPFLLTNQGTGAAIEGSSTAQFGIGMTAKTTGDGGWGLYAFSNGAGAKSINSFADNGTAFHGENNNPANTNTLMNLFNKGAGKTGSFQLANSSSTSANVQIAGNHLGEQLKIYQTNAANTSPAVSIENAGSGTGVEVISTTGYAVKGVTNTATGFAGVHGSNNGTAGSGVIGVSHAPNTQGVYGNSSSGIGVRGLSNSGTALYGNSSTGYALETNGKIKIAGGNTNPSAGAVLTSDATGNATWQTPAAVTPKIAFRAAGIADPTNVDNMIPSSPPAPESYVIRKKVDFAALSYDFGGVYTLYNGSNESTASKFTVPMTGLYHFDAQFEFLFAVTFDYREIEISLMVQRGAETFEMARGGSYINSVDNTIASVSTDLTLLAGDKVYVAARQNNLSSLPSAFVSQVNSNFFSGHLVFPFGN
ncbi:C1q-like domain-containing protein [Lacibacter sediminis]|uniref:C1q domain-containing protein n=1 Tax=Lacibacter sediminis TaxID=2760713 RepID=A0A7G5XIH0_9BACT|nr:hypothetical protein [Lacibacter sediminis]QNA45273.1 hypothetical protein H4075_03460 [Lacibacter sediminis]